MASTALLTAAAGAVVAPAAGATIVALAAPARAGLYRVSVFTEYAAGTLGAPEQAGLGTWALQDSTGAALSVVPVAAFVGVVTEYDLELVLDGATGLKVVNGATGGSGGVTYAAVIKAEFITNGYPTF